MFRFGLLFLLGAVCANGQLVNVTQLVEGKLQVVKPGVFKFVASVTLVETPGIKMIVDTTSPTDLATKASLLQKLSSMNLSPEKINVLVLTHGHPDHAGQSSMFPNAVLVSDFFEVLNDTYTANELLKAEAMELRRGVEVWKVPGHTPEDIAVIVRNVPVPGHTSLLTNVAITGDLFYTSEDALADTPIWTQTALDASKGKESKRKVICNVQNVIPGHGSMFAVTQQMRNFQNCVGVGRVNAISRAEPLQIPRPKSDNENVGAPPPRPYDGGYYGP